MSTAKLSAVPAKKNGKTIKRFTKKKIQFFQIHNSCLMVAGKFNTNNTSKNQKSILREVLTEMINSIIIYTKSSTKPSFDQKTQSSPSVQCLIGWNYVNFGHRSQQSKLAQHRIKKFFAWLTTLSFVCLGLLLWIKSTKTNKKFKKVKNAI